VKQILIRYRQIKTSSNSYYEKTLATGAVRCIDDEIPFDIPQGWEWARLNHITYIIEDCPHSTAKDEGIGFPLVRTPNVGFGRLILDRVHRVSEAVYRQRNARAIPQTNDLIFAREAPAGNIAVIQDGEKVCLGQRTVLVRPIVRCINPDYLAYYILSPISQQNLVDKSSGTTVAHVNLSDFRPYLVAVPPIKEQLRIIDRVAKLLPLIELYGIFYSKFCQCTAVMSIFCSHIRIAFTGHNCVCCPDLHPKRRSIRNDIIEIKYGFTIMQGSSACETLYFGL